MILEKLINTNELFDTIIGGTIAEFDIKSAGATAMLELKGIDTYNKLMTLEKKERNITIGLMMRNERGLAEKVNDLMLKYLNIFITENKIKATNFISSSRDSITVYNKLPMKTKFDHVEFRNKDGIFSSMYRIKRLTLFFDSMSEKVIGKGVADDIVASSPFINDFLKTYLHNIESCQKSGDSKVFNILRRMRHSYIRSEDTSIYRDLMNDNKMCVRYNGEMIYMENDFDSDDKSFEIAKDLNYINIILPIMRSVLING